MPLTTTNAFSSSAVSVDFLVYKRTLATDSFLRPMAWKYFSLPLPLTTGVSSVTKTSTSSTTGFFTVTFLTAFLAGVFPTGRRLLAGAFLIVFVLVDIILNFEHPYILKYVR